MGSHKKNREIFMSNHKMLDLSESEEMYILTIAQLNEAGHEGLVTLTDIAKELDVQPVSVNQMIRKLATRGYVNYQPYKGVELCSEGEKHVRHILRHRRLWEVFLIEHLGLVASEAEALACRFEHITPAEVTECLYHYLDEPAFTPSSKPIPNTDDTLIVEPRQVLSELGVGQKAEVIRVDAPAPISQFLESEGVRPGVQIEVLAIGDRGAILVQVEEGAVNLTAVVAEQIAVYV
jgi:DtxR family Mn-dependent transcriptional regulator